MAHALTRKPSETAGVLIWPAVIFSVLAVVFMIVGAVCQLIFHRAFARRWLWKLPGRLQG